MTRPSIICEDCLRELTEWARGLCRPCYERGSSHRAHPRYGHARRDPARPTELLGRRQFKRRHPTKQDPLGLETA